jgi:hypothetical protein
METKDAKGPLVIELTGEIETFNAPKNKEVKVCITPTGMTQELAGELMGLYLAGESVRVSITPLQMRLAENSNPQLAMSENVPCPKCGGTNTNVVKYVDEQPDTIYCADCNGTLHVPTPADLAGENTENATVPEPTVDPGTVVWVSKLEFAQVAAMDSRESIRRGEIMGIWQPDPETPETYCITAVFAGVGGSATAQRIIPEAQAKGEGVEVHMWTEAGDEGWKRTGWFVTFGADDYVTTGDTIALKAGTPPSWCVNWRDYDTEEDGEVTDSVRDTYDEAKALADELNDKDRKSATPGTTYTVSEWRPWIIEQMNDEGEVTWTSTKAYFDGEEAEGIAAELRKANPEATIAVRRSTAADDIAFVGKAGDPEPKVKCEDCPFPALQSDIDANGTPKGKECSGCQHWQIVAKPSDFSDAPGTITKDADGIYIHETYGPLRIQKIARMRQPWFVVQYKIGEGWETLEDERFPMQSSTTDMIALLEEAVNASAAIDEIAEDLEGDQTGE